MTVFGVIGMGSIAKRHRANLKKLHPECRVLSISASGRNAELPEFADEVINLDQLIKRKPTFVIVASPAPFHTATAENLIMHDIPVLIEKPLAESLSAAKKFQNQFKIKKPSSQVAVGYCLRFLPSAQIVKQFLESNKLGSVYNVVANVGQYLPDWRPGIDYRETVSASASLGGGVLLELSHEFDYLNWIIGNLKVVNSCLRKTSELNLEVEQMADVILWSENGIHISIHLDFIQKAPRRTCEFIGVKGTLHWNLIENTINFHSNQGVELIYADKGYDKNNMYVDMIRRFQDPQLQSLGEIATIESSIEVLELIQQARELNWMNK